MEKYENALTGTLAAENLSTATIARVHAYLKKKNPATAFGFTTHVVSDYFYHSLAARMSDEFIFYNAFPDEFEKIGETDETLYGKLVEMFNDAYFRGYRAGVNDLDTLLNQCNTEQ